MMKSAFDVNKQNESIDHKIVVALERISEAIRVLLWDEAKKTGLSPIQIQILVYLNFHSGEGNTPSYLAKEFNVTKATITDSVRLLLQKELITKKTGLTDARSYSICLTEKGANIAESTSYFTNELIGSMNNIQDGVKGNMLDGLYEVISSLNKRGVISVQRMCKNCRFYESKEKSHYCNLLKVNLRSRDLRIDCPEFQDI